MEGARRYYGRRISAPVTTSPGGILGMLALMLVVLFGAVLTGKPDLAAVASAVDLIAFVALLARAGVHHNDEGHSVSAEVSPTELTLSDQPLDVVRRVHARSSLHSGYVLPFGREGLAVLRSKHRERARIRFRDIATARELIHDLALSPLERPLTFSFLNLRITIGIDGVLVERPLTRYRRFVPHDAIFQVRKTRRKVILELENGTVYEILTKGGERHEALVERIIEAVRAYGAAEHAEPLASLRRNGRTTAAWVKELRAMRENAGGGYRSASVPEDTLWRVALDPSEPEEDRIGAGLALRSKLDDDGRTRLRVAAEAAVSPKVRIALESAANEADDDAVAETLQRRL